MLTTAEWYNETRTSSQEVSVSFVDFAELKARMSIEEAVQLLNIDMHRRGDQLRSSCPHCGGGDRTLVVTPSKGVYFCFKDGKGGDLIALAAHVREESVKDAAMFLAGTKVANTSTSKESTSRTVPEEKGSPPGRKLEPLSHLESEHEAVEAIGLDTKAAADHGIGYRTKGSGQGSVMLPFRDERGELIAYFGVQELTYIPPNFRPPENVVKFPKRSA